MDRLPLVWTAALWATNPVVATFRFSEGELDVAAIPAAAGALAVTGAGLLAAYQTTKLLTNDEFLSAMNKAHSLTYAAPSGD